ncbi:hypothetical protein LguiA_015804 [Lonicera macranthoides]
MYSNDPTTPLRALCYYLNPSMNSEIAFVQFPQLFDGINKNDSYGAEFKYVFQIDQAGMDGLLGPLHMGTGCFFRRRAFFGSPSLMVTPESPQLSPNYRVNDSIRAKEILSMAQDVASCKYEFQTKWGSEMGFRYGSLVEDFYTGFRLQCQGWKSIFCKPKRGAFLGNAPMTLDDLLNQTKRWSIGLLDVSFCEYSPINFGIKSLNLFQALCYMHYSFWPIWSIPVTVYAFLPQLALINSFPIFPKVSDPQFLLYLFLFLGAYGQDVMDFMLAGGTIQRWWNSQRMWMIRCLSSFSFALLEYLLKSLGISTVGFNVTSKVVDNDLCMRYKQGIVEYGVASPLFLPITMAAVINLVSFFCGVVHISRDIRRFEDVCLQMFLLGFVVVNSWPIYEAMVLRSDKGKMPIKITLISTFLAWILYLVSSMAF